MIFAFSTSSRLASVAVFRPTGELIWSGDLDAPQSAGAACFQLLSAAQAQSGADVHEAEMFVADVGPGSFTGVRVGIVLAKTFGFLFGKPCAGVDAFDLIDPSGTVYLPLKRGELFIRRPGEPLAHAATPPEGANGYGAEGAQSYPSAARCRVDRLVPVPAEELLPRYLVEPSISIPKRPHAGAAQ